MNAKVNHEVLLQTPEFPLKSVQSHPFYSWANLQKYYDSQTEVN